MRWGYPPALRQAVVPAALGIVATVELLALDLPGTATALVIDWTACALLVLRGRFPLAACTLAGLVLLIPVGEVDEAAAPILILALATITIARRVGGVRALTPLALFLAALAWGYLRLDQPVDVSDLVFVSAVVLPPYAFGRLMRSLDARNVRLAEQAELLVRHQELVRREAVAAERARIARDLHDVMAHSVSAMVVQAAAARDLLRNDVTGAEAAIDEVTAVGREALGETGRLLRLIRDTDDDDEAAAPLGLDRLQELVDRFRRSGLQVDLTVEGQLAALPADVDVSGYRIVQEALTNALRYATDRIASMRITRTATELRIRVENPASGTPDSGGGLGLLGMGERVAVLGGRLTHGRSDDGSFVLTADLPVVR
ncbi:signal transduction histidine kinase [Kribbella orskensis]|uniref:histidine kinase n=1 Tax=Kribbella orskensis TaxID=2512216 RepID=A0ABY2BRF6_9ACTN|nr:MULTISPECIES: histidine kinase [Kribbella]TCN43159.1 signal transduction histidine kinase [Kribbella sp. VKM Ac-2500]TCO29485.1 signal transduction histidine kinase [Kribbella orskensis]